MYRWRNCEGSRALPLFLAFAAGQVVCTFATPRGRGGRK